MNFWKPFRHLYIKTTNFTHKYQSNSKKLIRFYKIWNYCYDLSVGLDPAFGREMKKMITQTVKQRDIVLDIGCGTGISTLNASKIADSVTGIDLSPDMIRKLEQKINSKKITNIDLVTGSFPEALSQDLKFNSIISSFVIVHFQPKQRKNIYEQIFNYLENNGRIGLFSAQGEIASSFETEKEVKTNLEFVGFKNIEIRNVSDIYRIVTAEKI